MQNFYLWINLLLLMPQRQMFCEAKMAFAALLISKNSHLWSFKVIHWLTMICANTASVNTLSGS